MLRHIFFLSHVKALSREQELYWMDVIGDWDTEVSAMRCDETWDRRRAKHDITDMIINYPGLSGTAPERRVSDGLRQYAIG